MSGTAKLSQPSERRTLRWLLGGQVALAVLLVTAEIGPALPGLVSPSSAPELDQPQQPGDQTRRYRPGNPANPGPGVSPDMPRSLMAEAVVIDNQPGLSLRGAIAPGDGARMIEALDEAKPEIVTFDSPGGSLTDALEIGRAIRKQAISTRIDDMAVCLSACPYAFVGGSERSILNGGRLGVHQHSFGKSTVLPAFLATEDIQRGQSEVLKHLDKMGIDLRIMGPAMATPANEIYVLSSDELTQWRVISE